MSVSLRSSLTPYYRRDRRKWYARGTYPLKTPEGKIERKRGYVGEGSDTRAQCQADCDRLNREIEEAIKAGPLAPTFEEAVVTYLGSGGDARFLGEEEGKPGNRLLDCLAQFRCDEIDDATMVRTANKLYPTATAATINRQLYTPVISVLRLASKGKHWKPALRRPKGYLEHSPAKSPGDDWFVAVRAKCRPTLWALVLFDAIHGRRAGEALGLAPSDYDRSAGTILIDRTKNGEPVFIRLAKPVIEAIDAYDWHFGPGLFGYYTKQNRRNLYRDLALACEQAGVPYFTPHQAGRHAFAKRLLAEGKSLKHVKEAGKWKSMHVATLYGAFEHSEVDDDTRQIGEQWVTKLGKPAQVIELHRRATA